MLFYCILIAFIPTTFSLIDCVHGFVGRIQASIDNSFFNVNETRHCQARYCIRVHIYDALDDDNVVHQGISSRCAYTGGDRETCIRTNGCSQRSYYDGMKGNFSFCCCQHSNCNSPTIEEINFVYRQRSLREYNLGSSCISNFLLVFFLVLFTNSGA